MHCSQVFRSSAPSDLLLSSPGRRPSGAAPDERGSTRSTEWGVGPGGEVSHRGCCPAEISPRRAHPGRHDAGAGPLSGGRSHALGASRRAWNLHGNNAGLGAPVTPGRGRRRQISLDLAAGPQVNFPAR